VGGGARGGRSGVEGGGGSGVSTEENERATVAFVGCGGGLARGDASGVFPWRRELPAGVAWRASEGGPLVFLTLSLPHRVRLSSLSYRNEFLILQC